MKYEIVFHVSIILLALMLGYRWIWKPWAIQRFKASMSEERDTLFDYWQDQGLPTDNYAYTFLIDMLDKAHRNALGITAGNLLLHIASISEENDYSEWGRRFTKSVAELPVDAQRTVYFCAFTFGYRITRRLWPLWQILSVTFFFSSIRKRGSQSPFNALSSPYPQAATLALVTETTW